MLSQYSFRFFIWPNRQHIKNYIKITLLKIAYLHTRALESKHPGDRIDHLLEMRADALQLLLIISRMVTSGKHLQEALPGMAALENNERKSL